MANRLLHSLLSLLVRRRYSLYQRLPANDLARLSESQLESLIQLARRRPVFVSTVKEAPYPVSAVRAPYPPPSAHPPRPALAITHVAAVPAPAPVPVPTRFLPGLFPPRPALLVPSDQYSTPFANSTIFYLQLLSQRALSFKVSTNEFLKYLNTLLALTQPSSSSHVRNCNLRLDQHSPNHHWENRLSLLYTKPSESEAFGLFSVPQRAKGPGEGPVLSIFWAILAAPRAIRHPPFGVAVPSNGGTPALQLFDALPSEPIFYAPEYATALTSAIPSVETRPDSECRGCRVYMGSKLSPRGGCWDYATVTHHARTADRATIVPLSNHPTLSTLAPSQFQPPPSKLPCPPPSLSRSLSSSKPATELVKEYSRCVPHYTSSGQAIQRRRGDVLSDPEASAPGDGCRPPNCSLIAQTFLLVIPDDVETSFVVVAGS
ncbi:hypothetical protein C8F01DRAFT_1235620 [Mycena amicta]|nr:hypothetical protein C8F01DRAFT_1235620 [Mycena amicta]